MISGGHRNRITWFQEAFLWKGKDDGPLEIQWIIIMGEPQGHRLAVLWAVGLCNSVLESLTIHCDTSHCNALKQQTVPQGHTGQGFTHLFYLLYFGNYGIMTHSYDEQTFCRLFLLNLQHKISWWRLPLPWELSLCLVLK